MKTTAILAVALALATLTGCEGGGSGTGIFKPLSTEAAPAEIDTDAGDGTDDFPARVPDDQRIPLTHECDDGFAYNIEPDTPEAIRQAGIACKRLKHFQDVGKWPENEK